MSGWKDTIRNVAPGIGRALGTLGVPGAAAFAAVSQALLGKPDATEAQVAARVANWAPADELAMKAAEQKFMLDQIDKVIALEQVDAGDRANARAREVSAHDITTRILAYSVMVMLGVAMVMVAVGPVPPANHDAVSRLLDLLYAAVVSVLGYYFGSSVGSRIKDVAALRDAGAGR